MPVPVLSAPAATLFAEGARAAARPRQSQQRGSNVVHAVSDVDPTLLICPRHALMTLLYSVPDDVRWSAATCSSEQGAFPKTPPTCSPQKRPCFSFKPRSKSSRLGSPVSTKAWLRGCKRQAHDTRPPLTSPLVPICGGRVYACVHVGGAAQGSSRRACMHAWCV